MKATTSLLALSLLALAGVVTVSCGGSSNDGDSDNTAGSSSAGKGSGGSVGSAGTSSSAGKTSSAAGSGNGGSASSGGRDSQGGSSPGAGGELNVDECGDGVIAGMPCERVQGSPNTCQVDATTYCTCQGTADTTWFCQDFGDIGAGGAGGLFGEVACPAAAKTGDKCTGLGGCPDAETCACVAGTVFCAQ